jgi:hypothetical protein
MSHSTHHRNRFFRGALWLLGSGLLAGGFASCSSSNNGSTGSSGTQPTLTLTPSSISLTAGAAGKQASLLLAAPAGAGAATVTVSGLPTGVTVSPTALSLTPGTALPGADGGLLGRDDHGYDHVYYRGEWADSQHARFAFRAGIGGASA